MGAKLYGDEAKSLLRRVNWCQCCYRNCLNEIEDNVRLPYSLNLDLSISCIGYLTIKATGRRLDCDFSSKRVQTPVILQHSFLDFYFWEKYESLYLCSFSLNCITTVSSFRMDLAQSNSLSLICH